MAYNSDGILSTLTTIEADTTTVYDESKRQISVLDVAKIPYHKATKNLDRACHDLITPVNDSIYEVRNAYDERIDVQNCRTDLFWRLTGITTTDTGAGRGPDLYTFTCTKLNVYYPKGDTAGITSLTVGAAGTAGLSTNTVSYYDGTTFNKVELPIVGDMLDGVGSFFDTFYEPDNLHGYKLYDEPYAIDVFDTFRGVGVGTIGIGTMPSKNPMTILNPDLVGKIEVGFLATPDQPGYFASNSLTVTSVGTTSVDLSSYPFTGIATTKKKKVPYITVSELPVSAFDAPLPDGTFINILFSQDPSTIDDNLAVSIDDNPYVDQSIEIMSYSRAGAGVSIKYDNSGISSGTRSWNQFLDGLPDPDSEDPEDMDTVIREPPIGADKVYYRIGFPQKPIMYPGSSDASEGDSIQISELQLGFASIYQSLTTCDDTRVNAGIGARNALEADLASNPARDGMADVSNQVKKRLNDEFNIRIWAYRTQMGESTSRKGSYQSFKQIMDTSPYRDIMNAGSYADD
tara:strand:+ start:312 stop:1859 length:1548 start_codon:yes stop_codon:yes gene_type:complete